MDHKEFLQLIDSFIDGELSSETEKQMRDHAAVCQVCAEELEAAITVRDVLKGMDDNVTVPLEAEAAWKRAIRSESKRRNLHRVYRVASGIAAVFILIIGVNYFTKTTPETVHQTKSINTTSTESATPNSISEMGASTAENEVLSDGISTEAESNSYDAERKYETSDYEEALDTIKELTEEYEAEVTIGDGAEETSTVEIVVTIPGGSSEAFLDAISRIGNETVNLTGDLNKDIVTISITLIKI